MPNQRAYSLFLIVMSVAWMAFSCSIKAQAVTESLLPETASPAQQAAKGTSTNIVVSSEAAAPSPPENQSASSLTNNSSSAKVSDSLSATNAESSTNGVTDPPMASSTSTDSSVPLPMDPNGGSATEVTSEAVSPVNNTESIEKKKHEIKIRYNEVRTQVEKEEAVEALRQAADKASTTEGQRQMLKAYYELLFKRMKEVDASLTERCDVMQGAYLRRVEQKGLEPTIPLKAPPVSGVGVTKTSTPPATKEKLRKKKSTPNTAQ